MSNLTIPYSFSPNTTIFSAQVDANFSAVAVIINGNLDNSNIAAGANISLSKLGLNPGGTAFNRTTTGAQTWGSGLTSDSVPRVTMTSDAGLQFGAGGSSALDVAIIHSGTKTIELTDTAGGAANFDMNGGEILNPQEIQMKAGGSSILDMQGGSIINAGSISGASVFNAAINTGRVGISNTPGIPADGTSTSIWYFGIIGVYSGTGWQLFDLSAGITAAVPATTNTVYDVAVFYNGGTPSLVFIAWTGANTPPTRIYQNGILCTNNDARYRLVATVCTNAVSGQTSDRQSERFVWNFNNQADRALFAQITANSWTYASNAWQSSDANTTNGQGRFAFVIGLPNVTAGANFTQPWSTAATSINDFSIANGIALDSTSAPTSMISGTNAVQASPNRASGVNSVNYSPTNLTAGLHFYQMMEHGNAAGTTFTMYGGTGIPGQGMSGVIAA